MKAYIDKAKRASDNRICKPLAHCRKSAIEWIEDDDEPLGSRMAANEIKCAGCAICVLPCCGKCIEAR